VKLDVYTDGSGTTGGPAGIAFVAFASDAPDTQIESALPLESATNQQAEILAAAYALHTLPPAKLVTIWSDSEYLVKGWNQYLPQWLKNDWRRASGGQAKNIAYWQRLLRAAGRHETVSFQWLRGHDGHEHNERADKLAGEARRMALESVGTA